MIANVVAMVMGIAIDATRAILNGSMSMIIRITAMMAMKNSLMKWLMLVCTISGWLEI